jgi:hypothetical protein
MNCKFFTVYCGSPWNKKSRIYITYLLKR